MGVSFKRNTVFTFFIVFLVFSLSLLISPFYILEDQEIYRKVYSGVQSKGLIEAYVFYKSQIFTKEIGHFLIIWLASDYFDKDLIMAFINAALAYFSTRVLRQLGAHFLVVFSVVVLGYYSWVLFLSAERLKISITFLMAAIFFSKTRHKTSSFLSYFFSLITHLQTLVIVVVLLIGNYFNDIKRAFFYSKISKRSLFVVFFSLISLLTIVVIFSSHISSKVSAYSSDRTLVDFIRISLFFFASLYYGSREAVKIIMVFFILYIAIFFVGGERINVIGYYVFLYFCIKKRQGINFGFFLVTAYYFMNLVNYLSNVFQCGSNNPC